MGQAPGPAVLNKAAVRTRRFLFASPAFRAAFLPMWRAILEALAADRAAAGTTRWKLQTDVQDWVVSKIQAQSAGKGAEVIAVVSPAEAAGNAEREHVFAPEAFLSFIATVDPARTTLGLGNL